MEGLGLAVVVGIAKHAETPTRRRKIMDIFMMKCRLLSSLFWELIMWSYVVLL
jgi:hypothetical protein